MLPDPLLGGIGLVTGRGILEQVSGTPRSVPPEEVVLHSGDVLLGVHGLPVLPPPGDEGDVQPAVPPVEHPPDHYQGRVLHGWPVENMLGPVGSLAPPHIAGAPPDESEGQLVRVRDLAPVLGCPVQVGGGELHPGGLHPVSQEGLLGCMLCGVAGPLKDGPGQPRQGLPPPPLSVCP